MRRASSLSVRSLSLRSLSVSQSCWLWASSLISLSAHVSYDDGKRENRRKVRFQFAWQKSSRRKSSQETRSKLAFSSFSTPRWLDEMWRWTGCVGGICLHRRPLQAQRHSGGFMATAERRAVLLSRALEKYWRRSGGKLDFAVRDPKRLRFLCWSILSRQGQTPSQRHLSLHQS